MKKLTLFVIAVLMTGLCVTDSLNAQGEAAVPFLLISPNSRASGMGEGGTGLADDASAIFWNPGGLAFQFGQEVSITHSNWLPQFGMSDLFYDYLNYRNHINSLNGTIAASITYLNLGEHVRTLPTGPEPVGTFKSYEFAVTAGYATLLRENLGIGINLRLIHSALSPIGTEQEEGKGVGTTVSGDIGVLYKTSMFNIPLSLGANLSNLGPKITYIDAAQADPLPTNLRLGFGLKIVDTEHNELTFVGDVSRILVRRYPGSIDTVFNDQGNIEEIKVVEPGVDNLPKSLITAWGDQPFKKMVFSGGFEYWYSRLIALRAGYFHEEVGGRKFLTFGAGIRYDIYGFDFSYLATLEEKHPLADTLRFTLLVSW